MRHGLRRIALLTFLLVGSTSLSAGPDYAGPANPLVRLGGKRVLTTIEYPEWFQSSELPVDVRQQLIDSYTVREFLVSFDQSAKNAPATKWNDAGQLLLDLLGAVGDARSSLIGPAPTDREVNQVLREKVLPQLVHDSESVGNDSPSSHENEYDGYNGEQIRLLDLEIGYVRRHYNVPPDLRPDPSYRPTTTGPDPNDRPTTIGPAPSTVGPATGPTCGKLPSTARYSDRTAEYTALRRPYLAQLDAALERDHRRSNAYQACMDACFPLIGSRGAMACFDKCELIVEDKEFDKADEALEAFDRQCRPR